VKLWIGITNDDWFPHLSEAKPDEVNFWQPTGSRTFQVLQPGELFLFKLNSPNNYNVGGGHFVRSTPLPASLESEDENVLAELYERVPPHSVTRWLR